MRYRGVWLDRARPGRAGPGQVSCGCVFRLTLRSLWISGVLRCCRVRTSSCSRGVSHCLRLTRQLVMMLQSEQHDTTRCFSQVHVARHETTQITVTGATIRRGIIYGRTVNTNQCLFKDGVMCLGAPAKIKVSP